MTKSAVTSLVNKNVDPGKFNHELYVEGISLVNKVCNGFCFKYRIKDIEELHSHLIEKLVLIANKFEAGRNIPFRFFAIKSLNGYAFNFIRDHGRTIKIPRKYSELYLRYNALKKKNSYSQSLTVAKAAELLVVDVELLRKSIEAASLRFSEINDYSEYENSSKFSSHHSLIDTNEHSAALSCIKNMPLEHREILEEIYLDNKPKNRVFLNRGLTPAAGEKLLSAILKQLEELRDI